MVAVSKTSSTHLENRPPSKPHLLVDPQNYAITKTIVRFHRSHPVGTLPGALLCVRDVGLFARRRRRGPRSFPRGAHALHAVRELRNCIAAGIAILESPRAWAVQSVGGLDGTAEFSPIRRGWLVGGFRCRPAGGIRSEFPPDCRDSVHTCRGIGIFGASQCQLYEDHAGNRTIGEAAGGLARAESCSSQ